MNKGGKGLTSNTILAREVELDKRKIKRK